MRNSESIVDNVIESYGMIDIPTLETYVTTHFLEQLKQHDYHTYLHSVRVGQILKSFAKTLCLPEQEQRLLLNIGMLHDIGKLRVPASIIQKKGRLSENEHAIMRLHPLYGVRMLNASHIRVGDVIKDAVYYHHENEDGSGYPRKLKGFQIPHYAKMLRIADSFDAMTTQRPYSQPKSCKEALDILSQESGTAFDTILTETFCSALYRREMCFLNIMHGCYL